MTYQFFRLKLISTGLILATISSLAYAQQSDSAQQALEQLRMLQKQLSTDSPQGQSGGESSKNNKAQNQKNSSKQASKNNQNVSNQNNQSSDDNKMTGAESPNEKDLIDKLAFNQMSQQIFPMSPEEIIRLKQMHKTQEFAKESPAGVPPKPTATSQMVNLSPGSTPPVIRLSRGFVSSLVFLDSTGAPWPISAYDLGNPEAFNIQWDKTSNTLMIQSQKMYTYGNLAVRLKDLNTPVMLTLIPGQKAVDYRVDLRIQGLGPNAKDSPISHGLPPHADDVLLHVLDGVPPAGSTRLTVSGGDARAWLLNDKMYVRTNLTILSPGWIGTMTSADGMHAYEMQKSPVLLVSWHGKVMQLKVEGL